MGGGSGGTGGIKPAGNGGAGTGGKGGAPVAATGGTPPPAGMGGTPVAGMAGMPPAGMGGGTAGAPPPPPPIADGIVAVGYGGRRAFSTDGRSWHGLVQDDPTRVDGPKTLRGVAYGIVGGGEDYVVAVGGGCTGSTCTGRALAYHAGTWAELAVPADAGVLTDVAFGAGRFVAVGEKGPALVSTDGKTWAPVKNGASTGPLRRITFGMLSDGAAFVAVGDGGTRARSELGDDWHDVRRDTRAQPDDPVYALLDVTIGGGWAIAVGEGGRRYRSRDSKDWQFVAAGNRITSVVFADDQFLAYVDNGNVWSTKSAGQSWDASAGANTPRVSSATGLINGARLFVGSSAAAGSAAALVSAAGIAYEEMTGAPTEAPFLRFAFVGPSNKR